MNKLQTSLIVAALLGNLSMTEVKAMSLQAQNAAKANANVNGFSDWDYDEESDDFGSEEGPEDFEGDGSDGFGDGTQGCKGYRSCSRGSSKGCSSGCCKCTDEFDEVHCAIEDLCYKVCDVQSSQEIQDSCLAIIKADAADNGVKLDLLQIDVT